jgi:ribose transport system ATP-binding protein
MRPQPALQLAELRKQYGSTVALDGATFEVPAGSVHALLGENGAGKSTIVKILSGLARPDGGQLSVFGRPVELRTPRSAHDLGIRTAFQEISLIGNLSVSQNFLLMEEPLGPLGLIRSRRRDEMVRTELVRLGLGGIDPRAEVRGLDLPTRQKLEIVRAISHGPKLLLLDEPTASLSNREVQWLHALVEDLKATGTTVIFISHRMQEVRDFCSTMTILRNGKAVGSFAMDEVSDEDVIEKVIGRSLSAVVPPRPGMRADRPGRDPLLSVRNLSVSGSLADVSFALEAGRVVGLAALQGMGQRELFLALFGALERDSGDIVIHGSPVRIGSPAEAGRSRRPCPRSRSRPRPRGVP